MFGDGGNDVELFGMQRTPNGSSLIKLDTGFRPAIRVAMPWANDHLLKEDANISAPVDQVLERIVDGVKVSKLNIHKCNGNQEECDRVHQVLSHSFISSVLRSMERRTDAFACRKDHAAIVCCSRYYMYLKSFSPTRHMVS